jgi:DNA-directed RNA polymerase subunit L
MLLSNAELKIRLTEYELEYEALKRKVNECLQRMSELDEKYNKTKKELNNRTKGMI